MGGASSFCWTAMASGRKDARTRESPRGSPLPHAAAAQLAREQCGDFAEDRFRCKRKFRRSSATGAAPGRSRVTDSLRRRRGTGGNRFSIPPSGFPPLSTGESGLSAGGRDSGGRGSGFCGMDGDVACEDSLSRCGDSSLAEGAWGGGGDGGGCCGMRGRAALKRPSQSLRRQLTPRGSLGWGHLPHSAGQRGRQGARTREDSRAPPSPMRLPLNSQGDDAATWQRIASA